MLGADRHVRYQRFWYGKINICILNIAISSDMKLINQITALI